MRAEPLSMMALWKRPAASGEERSDRRLGAAPGLAEDQHVVRIAAEGPDVPLDPFEGSDQIQGAVVARCVVLGFRGQRRMRQVGEGPETAVDGDDDRFVTWQAVVVVGVRVRGTDGQPATVEEHHHRKPIGGGGGRGAHVEGQTVLADGAGAHRGPRSGTPPSGPPGAPRARAPWGGWGALKRSSPTGGAA